MELRTPSSELPSGACCPFFARAQVLGTDAQRDGPLLTEAGGYYWFSTATPSAAFCPWCGHPILTPAELHQSWELRLYKRLRLHTVRTWVWIAFLLALTLLADAVLGILGLPH
jgi:hypothetical protein